jgi:hypothetical protein
MSDRLRLDQNIAKAAAFFIQYQGLKRLLPPMRGAAAAAEARHTVCEFPAAHTPAGF